MHSSSFRGIVAAVVGMVFLVPNGANTASASVGSSEAQKAPTTAGATDRQGIVIYNPQNGHYYQSFEGSLTFEEAARAATTRSYEGTAGHLAAVTSREEYDFLVQSLFVYDYWIGAYRDPARLQKPPEYGWRWITGEPWSYANWNDDSPANKELVPHAASFWTGSMRWSPHVPSDRTKGYVVEYPIPATVRPEKPLTPTAEIDRFLASTVRGYAGMKTYQATVEFTTKAWVDTIGAVKADLKMRSDGRFRLEGRGDMGKLLAVSDGRRLMLALTAPRGRMKYVVKPMTSLPAALKEAFSLLSSSPKPPSIVDLVARSSTRGSTDSKIYSGKGVVGEYRETGDANNGEARYAEQLLRADVTIRSLGEDPIDGNVRLVVGLAPRRFTESEANFRIDAYPYTVRERHTDIKVDEPIADDVFELTTTANAEQVDDLGEGDEGEMTYSPRQAVVKKPE